MEGVLYGLKPQAMGGGLKTIQVVVVARQPAH